MAGIAVAVVCSVAPAVGAGADPLGSAKAQEASVAAEIQAGAARIRALTLAYEQANLVANSLQQQVAQDQAQLQQLRDQVASTMGVLRYDAIISYTGGAANGSVPAPPAAGEGASSVNDPSVRVEYLQVAAGDITDAVDRYRTGERAVVTAESTLAREEKASEVALAQTAAARQAALNEAAAEQAQLAALQVHVAQLTQAIALAAAAAQQQAAQQQAAQRQAAERQAAQASQGLPVNNGLLTVVRTIVTAPAGGGAAGGSSGAGSTGGVWLQLRECESGNNYQENSGNGYYGAYQFSAQTWAGLGYPGRPDLEPPAMQDQAAMKLQQEAGWGQWPACAAALGLT
jgi:resuscitation-promoting factor RpfB